MLKSTICNGNVFQTLIAQAFVFGICHSSRSISGGDNDLTVPSIQALNGLLLGSLYLLTNGDLFPCIIAHGVSLIILYFPFTDFVQLDETDCFVLLQNSYMIFKSFSLLGYKQMIKSNMPFESALNLYQKIV